MSDKASWMVKRTQNDHDQGPRCVYCCTLNNDPDDRNEAWSVERHETNSSCPFVLGPNLENDQSGGKNILCKVEGEWNVKERPCPHGNPMDTCLIVNPPKIR